MHTFVNSKAGLEQRFGAFRKLVTPESHELPMNNHGNHFVVCGRLLLANYEDDVTLRLVNIEGGNSSDIRLEIRKMRLVWWNWSLLTQEGMRHCATFRGRTPVRTAIPSARKRKK